MDLRLYSYRDTSRIGLSLPLQVNCCPALTSQAQQSVCLEQAAGDFLALLSGVCIESTYNQQRHFPHQQKHQQPDSWQGREKEREERPFSR